MKNWLKRLDNLLEKLEKGGFKLANFTYKTGINLLFVFMGYTIYTTLRDYNEIQKEARKKELFYSSNKKYFENEEIDK